MLADLATASLRISRADAASELLARRKARERLIEFACYVDPKAAGWYRAKHLQKAAEYFEAVERGEIRRLIINWPPRHWKTSLIEKFCAWYLGRHPEKSIILASYAEA